MEEINFIRPQEVFNRNTGESKVRYTSYDGSNKFIPVVDGEDGVPRTLVVTTHAELKAMRDAGKLTPGALYRITDYQCTTTQANTRSAGHQFDIVLLALSENKLAEEGWAMEHPTDVYEVTFYDNVTLKCWIYNNNGSINIVKVNTPLGLTVLPSGIEINESNKTAVLINPSAESTSLYDPAEDDEPAWIYNYFQNSNLSAWKVWYCLDNDTARFAWADDSVDEDVEENIKINGGTTSYFRYSAGDTIYENTKLYAWKSLDDIIRYSKIEEVESGILVYQFLVQGLDSAGMITSYTPYHKGTGPNGRGVIYRMIDEWNNDVACDFKNIQLTRLITDGAYDDQGTATWCYILSIFYDNVMRDGTVSQDSYCYDNKIMGLGYLPSVVIIGGRNNTIDSGCEEITIVFSSSVSIYNTDGLVVEEQNSLIYLGGQKVLTES